MRKLSLCAAAAATVIVSGCATAPDHIAGTYVSPTLYASYDCAQIREELQRVSYKVAEVTGQQQSKARNDELAMGVGLVLFWPALFLLAAGSDHKAELQSLKGTYDALNEVAIQKRCRGESSAPEIASEPAPVQPVPAVQAAPAAKVLPAVQTTAVPAPPSPAPVQVVPQPTPQTATMKRRPRPDAVAYCGDGSFSYTHDDSAVCRGHGGVQAWR